jgi:hypothetical protein
MDDGQREREQEALRNVRALVERIEHEDLDRRRRQWLIVAGLLLAVAVFLGTFVSRMPDHSVRTPSGSCEIDVWNAKAAGFMRNARQASPDIDYGEIQKSIERKRSTLMAEARRECSSKAK